jgi:hypothetical protein
VPYFADDIANYLATNGCGTINTSVTVGRLPDSPDNVLAVFERPGRPPFLTMTGASAPEDKTSNPRVQIRVRDTAYDAGRTKIYLAFSLLQGKTNVTLVGTPAVTFRLITAVQSPTHLGLDEEQRHEWTLNMDLQIDDDNR